MIREKFRGALRKKKKNRALVREQEAAVSLQTITAAKEISVNAAVAALLSNFRIKSSLSKKKAASSKQLCRLHFFF